MLGNSIGEPIGGSSDSSGGSTPPPSDGTFTKINYTLSTHDGTPQVNLSGLEWALFKELKPSLFTSPVAKGSAEGTDAGAVLDISVPANTVPAGQYFLVLTNGQGTITLACIISVT